ncbi:MAG: sulfatase-like hydrolase/transferase [Limisphaerales bacterium]
MHRTHLYLGRLALAFFLSAVVNANAETQASSSKPNIVFILTDDLGFGDVGTFFQHFRKEQNDHSKPWQNTPNLDRMADEGIKLTDHYCPAPVCAPSRSSLMLGVHQGHANVRDNQFDKALENNHTLATVMKAAGYKTAAFGKWGLQGKGNNPASWPAYPTKRGFDYYFGYVRHRDGHEHYPKEGLYRETKQVWDNDHEISAELDKCYTADLWTARAKKWIMDEQATNAAQPFFVYLAFDTPHAVLELPTQAYPGGSGAKGGLQWLGKTGHMINTASGTIDSWIHPDYANATWDNDNDPKTPEVAWPTVYKRYATAVRRVDDCVGDVLQLLRDLHLETNTLVVFTSDNGPEKESFMNESFVPTFFNSFGPFDGIKRDLWEGGFRVPTIVWWPGKIKAGTTSSHPSQSHDWMPTFAQAAALPAPSRSDGVSLLPVLTGQGEQRDSIIYSEYFHNAKTPDYSEFSAAHRGRVRHQMQAIRIGDFQGVRYNVQSHSDNFEIYDVAHDKSERINVGQSADYARMQQQMKDTVLQLRRPDAEAARPYDNEFVPATDSPDAKPGVQWFAYEGRFPWVPQFSGLHATKNGIAAQPTTAVRTRNNDVGLLFTGLINVPSDGDYTFYLNADTAALLRIHEATVVDADFGYKGGAEKLGTIRLKAGKHAFRLSYARQSKGQPSLKILWSGPGFEKQVVPEKNYFHSN